MTAGDAMTTGERHEDLKRQRPRYRAADRTWRSALLTAMAAVTGWHRASRTRLLAARLLSAGRRGAASKTQLRHRTRAWGPPACRATLDARRVRTNPRRRHRTLGRADHLRRPNGKAALAADQGRHDAKGGCPHRTTPWRPPRLSEPSFRRLARQHSAELTRPGAREKTGPGRCIRRARLARPAVVG